MRFVRYLLLAAVLSGSCATKEDVPDPPIQKRPLELDLSSIVSRARYAFRTERGELRAFGDAHEVRVGRDSAAFFPIRSPAEKGAPLHLRTRSIARGESVVDNRGEGFTADREGALQLARGPSIERLVNAGAGLEQSWSFAHRIAGKGDLVIRVEASGYQLAGETESGLHFRDSKSGLYVRYGHGTWLDGKRKTAVRASFRDGMIELRVPADVVDESAYPAVLDPVLSPETSIDQPIQWPASGPSSEPAVAHGAGVFMVVWSDGFYRGGLSVARVRESDGAILDMSGIPISDAPAEGRAIEYDGAGNFVVVHSVTGFGVASRIYAQRVRASDGVLLDPTRVLISDAQAGNITRTQPAIARGANGLMIVWRFSDGGAGEIHGRRINFDLTPIDPADVNISDIFRNDRDPDVDFADGHYLMAWETDGNGSDVDIQARRVRESDGALLDAAGLIASTPGLQRNPAIADDGTRFLIVWEDNRSSRDDVRGRRMVAATGAFDTPDSLLRIGGPNLFNTIKAVDHDASGYLVTWGQATPATISVYGRRVTDDVVPLDGPLDTGGVLLGTVAPGEASPRVAAASSGFFVVWQQAGTNVLANQAAGRRVDTALAFLDPTPLILSTQTTRQIDPEVAYANGIYLVVWYDRRVPTSPDRYDVYAARIRESDGVVLDPIAIELFQDVIISQQSQNIAYAIGKPSVASDGTAFLVAWPTQLEGIRATRIDAANGTLLDQPPMAVSAPNTSARRPATGFAAGNYLVAWDSGPLVRAVRINATTGAVLDTPPLQPGIQNFDTFLAQALPAIACAAPTCLIVWRGTSALSNPSMYAARFDMVTGAELDPQSIVLSVVFGNQPDAASDGSSYFVVFGAPGLNGYQRTVGREVRSDGTVVGASTVEVSDAAPSVTFEDGPPSIAFDGRHYLVAWADRRNNATNGEFAEVRGRRLESDGTPVDVVSFPVSSTTAPALFSIDPNAAIASSGRASSLIVYPRFDQAPPFRNFRIKARFFENLGELGETCTSTVVCGSGFCADGVCCDAECGSDPSDCQSCAGGVCQMLSGTVCRAASLVCDAPEVCDGVSSACPADEPALAGTTCRTSTVSCDPAEVCDGVSFECPEDDVGCADAGIPDADVDAGIEVDGGADGGVDADGGADAADADAAEVDAAADTDAAVPMDAEPALDAKPGLDAGPEDEEDEGCGCSTTIGHRESSFWFLLGCVVIERLRRRRKPGY